MELTDRERQVVGLLRANPMMSSDAIADRLGTTRAAVNVHLSNLGKKGAILGRGYLLAEQPGVVVIGGANMDMKAHSSAPTTPATSNPGHAVMSPGGVGRNIAENLARLGTRTHFIGAVGRDPLGESLMRDTAAGGVHLDYVYRTDTATGTYVAVLDDAGELVIAVSDMTATAELTPARLGPARDLIGSAELVILDCNLPAATVALAHDTAATAGVRTVIEPVSVAKAAALHDIPGLLSPEHPLFLITPNRDELASLTGLPVDTERGVRGAADALHAMGVAHVWVRLGASGSLLSSPDGATHIDSVTGDVLDVTGAGDSLLAGFCHALLAGADPADAARYGHAAAALTIASNQTVRDDLTARLVTATLESPAKENIV